MKNNFKEILEGISVDPSMQKPDELKKRFNENLKEANRLVKFFDKKIKDYSKMKDVSWSHLGDLGRIVEKLKELSD